MDLPRERLGVYCGLAAPLVFLALYSIALVGDPEYVFFENYLSDLGVGRMAWAFNSAVIIAGGLMIPFALLAVRPALRGGILAELAVGLTVMAAAFLILVGVFTEDYEGTHYIVSMGFFISFLAALFFYSAKFAFSDEFGLGISIFTYVAFATGCLLAALGFDPRTETIAVLLIIAWGLAIDITLYQRGADADTL